MTEKVIGYSLLAVGVLVIVLTAVNVFFVFTGRMQPIQLFNLPAMTFSLAPGTKPVELMTADAINQTSNLAINLFLMGFLASAGQKLASLGVQLVRPIIIKSRDDKTISSNSWTPTTPNNFPTR